MLPNIIVTAGFDPASWPGIVVVFNKAMVRWPLKPWAGEIFLSGEGDISREYVLSEEIGHRQRDTSENVGK